MAASPKHRSARPRRSEDDALRQRLEEAEQALEAIRTGQVESLVIEGPGGPRIFSLEGASASYRVLVEAMSEGAATVGLDGTVLYCNGAFARLLDAPLEHVMGARLEALVPASARPGVEALLREAQGGEGRRELVLADRRGQPVPAYFSARGFADDGRPAVALVATDLREQKRSEQVLAAERLSRAVFAQAADAIVVCDAEGRVIRASEAATDLLGAAPVGRGFDEAFPVAVAGGAAAGGLAATALRGQVLRAVAASFTRADGVRYELLASAAPLHGSDAEMLGCVITLVDVSEVRRTAVLLAEERERLAEADRRKDEFLATLSHELRNPLAPIRNSLFILDKAAPGGEQARRARAVIERQTEHMSRLINDLLDVTRIARGKVRLHREPLDLVALVAGTAEDHRAVFDKSGLALEVSLPEAPVPVEGDPTRLAQVLGNLLQNAAKFTPPGGRVRLSLRGEEPGRSVVVEVADTGVGLEPEMLGRVFQPFAQADRSLDRSPGGLGLGLALARGLVELHGGRITVDSGGRGRGTTFQVHLPLGHATAAAGAPPGATAAAAVPLRILVVEDNHDAADTLREALEILGHRVQVAYSGPMGIERARAERPDVLLCDIGLPVMSGYEVARAFRADPALRGVRLVALTGYGGPEDRRRVAEASFELHLTKPIGLPALQALLAELAQRSASGREMASRAGTGERRH